MSKIRTEAKCARHVGAQGGKSKARSHGTSWSSGRRLDFIPSTRKPSQVSS